MKRKLRLLSRSPINLTFYTRENFVQHIEQLKSCLVCLIFSLTDQLLNSKSCKQATASFVKQVFTREWSTVEVLYVYDLDSNDCLTPTIEITLSRQNRLHSLRLHLDVLYSVDEDDLSNPMTTNETNPIHSVLCKAVENYLDLYAKAVLHYWNIRGHPPKSFKAHHYSIDQADRVDQFVTLFYAKEMSEEFEQSLRTELHQTLQLPTTSPIFRRGQAILPVPYLINWLGPNEKLLVCPHNHLKPLTNGLVYVVRGNYTYKHYLQDGLDDKNWGCAYRSLQTLISWLMWQGEISATRLPSLNDIQSSLVRVGDKPKNFIGSRQWIGSLEVSFCLDELYKVQCRLLPVPKGNQMSNLAAPQLAEHFSAGGGPVMVGGGQLAHTIIGIYLPNNLDPSRTVYPRFLILDPHFTGPSGQLKPVIDKGWCGWKDCSFWKPDVHYNLCFLPPIQPGRV